MIRNNCLVHPWWKPCKNPWAELFWITSKKIRENLVSAICLLLVRHTRICPRTSTLSRVFSQLFEVFCWREVLRGSCDYGMKNPDLSHCKVQGSPGSYEDLDDKCAFLISSNCCGGNSPNISGIFLHVLWRVICQLSKAHAWGSFRSFLFALLIFSKSRDWPSIKIGLLAELPADASNLAAMRAS